MRNNKAKIMQNRFTWNLHHEFIAWGVNFKEVITIFNHQRQITVPFKFPTSKNKNCVMVVVEAANLSLTDEQSEDFKINQN